MKKTENLKSFALMLLFVSAALAVTVFMLPSGRISKTAKSVLTVFIFMFFISFQKLLFSEYHTSAVSYITF